MLMTAPQPDVKPAVHSLYCMLCIICETFALQALVTLEWLVALDPGDESSSDIDQSNSESDLPTHILHRPLLDDPEVQLAKDLWKMLHQLLIHPLLDLSKDMQRIPSAILTCAAPSLRQPGLKDFLPFTELVSVTLRRITQDKAQYKPDPYTGLGIDEPGQEGSHRFTVFWSFLGTFCLDVTVKLYFNVLCFRPS